MKRQFPPAGPLFTALAAAVDDPGFQAPEPVAHPNPKPQPTTFTAPATERQMDVLESLLDQGIVDDEVVGLIRDQIAEGKVDKARASRYITSLIEAKKTRPRKQREDAPEPDAGMYRRPDGTIIRVYLGQNSGKMLAKQLVDTGEAYPEVEGEAHRHGTIHKYEYLGKATRFVKDAQALTLEEAKEFGRMSGTCCRCARQLDVPESVEAGIGPVCAKKMEI